MWRWDRENFTGKPKGALAGDPADVLPGTLAVQLVQHMIYEKFLKEDTTT